MKSDRLETSGRNQGGDSFFPSVRFQAVKITPYPWYATWKLILTDPVALNLNLRSLIYGSIGGIILDKIGVFSMGATFPFWTRKRFVFKSVKSERIMVNETVGLSVVCSLGYTIHAKLISRLLSGALFSKVPITLRAQKCLIFRSRSKNTK